MGIVIQKFESGILAIPKLREMAAQKVVAAVRAGYAPIVVVSAMGQGDPYATDTLAKLCESEHVDTIARSLDMAMACGGILSAVVFASTLRRLGYEAIPLTGGQAGILTDEAYGQVRVLGVLPKHLGELMARGRIPVVAGGQGVTMKGDLTTLGQNGSDMTAVLLGEALEAICVEMYADTDDSMIHPDIVAIAQRSGMPLLIRSIQNNI